MLQILELISIFVLISYLMLILENKIEINNKIFNAILLSIPKLKI